MNRGRLQLDTKKIRNLRWWIVGTCFLATAINYLDRQCLSVAAPVLCKELHISNAGYSSILTAFMIAYCLMQAISGRISDYLGTRLGMALSIVVWSAAGVLHAFAGGVRSLCIIRFLLGAGEAGNWPASTKAVSEWFPARERALAVSIFDSGSALGGMLAPPVVAWIILHFGWRPAFVVTGLLGFLWLGLWLSIYHLPDQHPSITLQELQIIHSDQEVEGPSETAAISTVSLLRLPALWGVISGRFLTDSVWWFYVYWLPKYLSDYRGFSLAQIAASAWIPFVAGGLGSLVFGWLSGYLIRRGWSLNRTRKSIMLLGVFGMVAGLPAGLTWNARLCVGLIAVAALCYAAWATMLLTLPSDLFPSKVVATAAGLAGMGAGVGGIVSSWTIGWVVDRFSYRPVFVVAGLLPLIAMGLVQLCIPKVGKSVLRG